MKLPDHDRVRGRRIRDTAVMIDLMPTILDALGIGPSEQAQGMSLMPAILDERSTRDAAVFRNVVRTPRYKYFGGEDLLFDLVADPLEQTNLFAERPDLVEDLALRLAAERRKNREHLARHPVDVRELEVPLSPEHEAELEALGYVR